MDDKEFDIKVRSLLENAEEEAPSYLMDNIFTELDNRKSRRRAAVIWWRRAGAVAAVAAVAVLCVFLFPKGGSTSPEKMLADDIQVVGGESGSDSQVVGKSVEVNSDLSESATLAVAWNKDDALATEGQTTGQRKGSVSRDLLAMAEIPENDSQAVTGDFSSDDDSQAVSSDEAEPDRTTANVKDGAEKEAVEDLKSESFSDTYLWDDDEDEDARRKRVALVVNGDVSSNANPAASNSTGRLLTHSKGEIASTSIKQTSKESSYSIPVSFGLGVKINLTDRWALGTGLNYTMLGRTFYGTYTKAENGRIVRTVNSDIRNTLHYIGIPVNVFYNIVNSKRINFYAYAGGTVEKGLTSRFTVKSSPKNHYYSESVDGVQLSAGGGIGVEFKLIDELSLYIDPGVTYYFDCDQPMSIRTQQPFMMDFEIGLRVLL